MRNIVLVGFMGTGKTAVAKELARDLEMAYVSVDDLIEESEKRKISDIFRDNGEPYFRKLEKNAVKEASKKRDQIIDTGGGVVLDEENMKRLKKGGIVICLWAKPEAIFERTSKSSHRPLLKTDDLERSIKELLEKRKSYYEKADFHVETTGLSVTVVADRIKTIVKERDAKAGGKKNGAGKNGALKKIFLTRLLNNIKAIVLLSDSRGRIVFANTRSLEFFGSDGKNIVGTNWIGKIVPRLEQKAAQKTFSEIKKKKTVFWFNSRVVTPYSSDKRFLWMVIPLRKSESTLYMMVGGEEGHPGSSGLGKHALTQEEEKITCQGIVEMLFDASSVSEPWIADHSSRVAQMSVALAREINMSKGKIEKLKMAAILHDLGKLGIDKKILLKKGKLTAGEYDQMKKHSDLGAEAARLIYFLGDLVSIIISHHENYDGSGYPSRLSGDDIPIEARVLSVADIFEALTSDRPYRKKFTIQEAVSVLDNEKGHKLDPKLTDIFMDMVKKGKIEG